MTRGNLAVILFVISLAPGARGQDVVPGGWAPQFGFQSFSEPGFSGAGGTFSFGSSSQPGVPAAGFLSAGFPASGATDTGLDPLGQPQVVNGLVPLADVVRRSARRRHVR